MISPRSHDFASPDKSKMQALPVDCIKDNSTTDFDLYVEAAGMLTLYAQAEYRWSRDELSRLVASGHQQLFYPTVHKPRAEVYLKLHRLASLDTESHPRLRIVNLTAAAAEMTRVLYDHEITPSIIARTGEIAHAMVNCIKADPLCITALGLLVNHDEYTYYHSARVAAYGLAIAVFMGESDEHKLRDLALGSLLHDVGKSKIERGILGRKGALGPKEWVEIKKHPEYGAAMLEASGLGLVPQQIILHHHERFDGTGYPHQLTDKEILEEVKIAAFADVFDALTTNRPYQVTRTRFEALALIRDRLLPNLHQESYNAMVELLAGKIRKYA
ncbi:MAG: HD domain-containing protein [Deltaproteobacteria bacterium]|nr:HD domain-containing protein [Deltaproteobacteria bacterium]